MAIVFISFVKKLCKISLMFDAGFSRKYENELVLKLHLQGKSQLYYNNNIIIIASIRVLLYYIIIVLL